MKTSYGWIIIPTKRSLVWLQQSVVTPMQTLDQGNEIEVPGGVIQHWLGAVYLEHADARERARPADELQRL